MLTKPLTANGTGKNEYVPVSSGGHAVDETMTVLRTLAKAARVPYDPTRAAQLLRQAEHDVPPTAARAARLRLVQAAEGLGLHVVVRQFSVREALQAVCPEAPLALFTVTHDGHARWFLLLEGGRYGRLLNPTEGDGQLLPPEVLADRLGAEDADTVLEWLAAIPAAPLGLAGDVEEHHDTAHHGPSPLARLWGLLLPERRDLWTVLIYAVGIGVLSLATPLTVMAVVNTAALATLMQQLVIFCLVLFICLGLGAILRGLQAVVVEYLQQRLFVRVVGDLAFRLPRIDVAALDRQHGPELVNRFFDVLTVQKAGATLLLDGVAVALQTMIGLVLLAAYHEMLLGFDLLLIGALVLIIFGLGRGAVASSIRESRAKYAVAGWLEELARNPRAFKLGSGPRFARERADRLARIYLLARQGHFRILLRQFGFALALQVIASTALLALGGYLVIKGQLTLGQLVAAEIVVALVVAGFTKLGKHLENYYDLLAAVDKLGYLVDLPLERTDGIAHPAHHGRGATLRMHNVTFGYQGSGRVVLEDFNLVVAPGERVALLGPNGSGKSTLLDLIFGLRAPERGHVEVDGADVRDLQLKSLREHVALVKGIEIFEGTLLDNIRMGREELTISDIRTALEMVGLLDEVLDLPQGLQTWLNAGGQPLSLGQAERLMLARAVAGRPRLLVLDEALDSIDLHCREQVLAAVLDAQAPWTALVVTHRPDVAARCGRQVVLGRNTPRVGASA